MYQDALPRRTSLGIELAPRTGEVLGVVAGGTADAAGVARGDRIVAVDDGSPLEPRRRGAGDRVAFVVERAGERRTLVGEARPAPVERVAGAAVRLGHVTLASGVRLRTLTTIPDGAPPPFHTVLLLPGLGHASCELGADADDPRRKLLEGLTSIGLSTVRVERSGTGDSEGPPSSETDLFVELEGYRAALDALDADPDVARVWVVGQSVGGMIAPILAPDRPLVVFGTSARRWVDCIVRGTRIQRRLAGDAEEDIEAYVAAWAEMHALVCREGRTPEEVFALRPHLRSLEGSACRGRALFGRDVAFFQQIERVDLEALWRTVEAPVLVLAGAYDWICAPDDGRRIAELAPAATFVELPATGHDMRAHASLERSFVAPREGRWDGAVVAAIRAFVAAQTALD